MFGLPGYVCYLFYKPWEVLFPIVCVDLNAPRGKSDTTQRSEPSLKSYAGATWCKNFLEIYISRIEKFPAINLFRNSYYSFSTFSIAIASVIWRNGREMLEENFDTRRFDKSYELCYGQERCSDGP